MPNIDKLIPQGRGLAAVLVRRSPNVALTWEQRSKARFEAVDSDGRALIAFLPPGTQVRSGDVLVADDGSFVQVQAAAQPVLEVRACAAHGTAADLVRAAYRLGQRHVAVDVRADHLRLAPEDALAEALRAEHLLVVPAVEAFEPDAGQLHATPAHGSPRACAHAHGRGPDHAHAHDCAHDHDQGHAGHVHHDHHRRHGHEH